MAHVILGFLLLWPQSLYELTKSFEAGVSLFYSASIGSIKRALDRLLAEGHIRVESEDGPRGKKVYAVTDAGRAEFRRWMLAELTGADFETAALSRAHFLGLVEADDRLRVAAHIEERIRWDLDRLERLEAKVATTEVPEGFDEVARFQLATLQYGLSACRTALAWAEEYLPQQ
ncbi:MAG: PadR family transcriptional regulator [Propionibacteriaceae bacterium]